jgi:predicted enzyme related to lactoylglutathione lyase
MERITGIGGVFLRSGDPPELQRWYETALGLEPEAEGVVMLRWQEQSGRPASTVWSPFPADTDYFGDQTQQAMINYRVRDLDAMLAQLREAGAVVDDHVEVMEFGRFGWATDPEGRRFELWEPAEGL